MSSKERSKGKSTEKLKEKKAGSKKASASAAAPVIHSVSAANITAAVGKNISAYENVNEANLNAILAGFDYNASSVPAGSASAAVPAPRSKKSVERLKHASEAVASSSAAAVQSSKAFAAVVEKLDEASRVIGKAKVEAAAAEDTAFVAAIKAQLAKDSKLGDEIIRDLGTLPPMLQCNEIKLFLGKLYASSAKIKESARKSLHPYILGAKALTCRTTTTEKDVVGYLIDIIGVARKVGEPARGILFRTDIFRKETVEGLPLSSSEALDNYFVSEWRKFRSSKGGSRKRRRRLNRRLNRTKKI